MTANLPTLSAPDLDREIEALAHAARRANGPLMSLVNRLGGGVERRMALLPPQIRAELERVTAQALMAAHGLAGIAEADKEHHEEPLQKKMAGRTRPLT